MELGYESWEAMCSAEIQIYTDSLSRELIKSIHQELIVNGGMSASTPGSRRTGADSKSYPARKPRMQKKPQPTRVTDFPLSWLGEGLKKQRQRP